MKQDNEYWMKQALIQADKAFQLKEVPVGAIIFPLAKYEAANVMRKSR